jgi:Rad3-related DNA helicase
MTKKIDLKQFFPDNFSARNNQIDVLDQISKIWSNEKKYIIACIPTGVGKSHIAYTLANSSGFIDDNQKQDIISYQLYKKNSDGEYVYDKKYHNSPNYGAFVMTVTKSLQDQYQNIFTDIHSFKGKNNYQCQVDLNQTTDFAPCIYSKKIKEKCFSSCLCPYYEAKNKAIYDRISILNYRSFFNLRDFLKNREVFICDEADGIEEELVSQFTLEINYSFLKSCGISFKKILSDDLSKAKVWLFDIFTQTESQLNDLKKKSLALSKENHSVSLQDKQLQMISRLSRIHNNLENTIQYWDDCKFLIEERKTDKVVFIPYNVKPLFHNNFGKANKVLLMSATLSNHKQFAKSMGIDEKDYDYIETDSPFDPNKSPIYCSTKYNLSYKSNNKDLDDMINVCISLCEKHKAYKGIIHTHTNTITQEFFKKLKGDSRFLFRMEGISNEDILQQHKESPNPTVLISPSMDTGISLDGDLGRFQIVIKAPFLPLNSKRIKAKFDANPEQYSFHMLNTLVQMSGRCTRSKDDYSITYILDGNATKAIKQYKDVLPKHFLKRIH